MSHSDLRGKVAIITGATSGIGLTVSKRFAELGVTVIASGQNVQRGTQLVDEIKAKGGKAHFIAGNISKSADIKKLFNESRQKFGVFDIFCNNAGVMWHDHEDWKEMININFVGAVEAVQTAIAQLKEAKKRRRHHQQRVGCWSHIHANVPSVRCYKSSDDFVHRFTKRTLQK